VVRYWIRLDAAVTTRASATDYTTARATKLDNLDTNVGSRSTYAGGPVASVAAPVALAGLDSPVLQSGTAQAGTLGTITLASGASATDNIYRGGPGQDLQRHGRRAGAGDQLLHRLDPAGECGPQLGDGARCYQPVCCAGVRRAEGRR
jgi:hypothetical protein